MQIAFTPTLIPDSIERVRVFQECVADSAPRSNGVQQLLRDIDRMLARTDTAEGMTNDVQSQLPITLKLRFGKELVSRSLMGKRRVRRLILPDTNILIPSQ